MTLVLTFVLVTVAVAAVLGAVSLFVQPYLYGEPADRLPLRAAVGGLAVGCFLTVWVYANTRADRPDKYGTFFEFNPVGSTPVAAFEAVERSAAKGPDGTHPETTIAFKHPAARADGFVQAADPTKPYRVNTADSMVVAIVVAEPDGKKSRYDADLTDAGVYRTPDKIFREVGGSRFLEGGNPAVVYAPSTAAVVVAVGLNVFHFVLWYAVFWAGLRYGPGMALGLAAGFGLATMLIALPLLFEINTKPAPPTAAAAG